MEWWEHTAKFFEPTKPRWDTPGVLARDLDPSTAQTPALDLIDKALVEAYNTPDSRLIISMPPQEGKSQRASRRFPEWVLTQNPDTRIAMASYEHGIARRWGRTVRNDIETNPVLGLQINPSHGAQHDWTLNGYEGGMYSTGIGGALTGRPVDLLLIDDPVKDRAQAESKTIRENIWNWWTDVASTRLAPGASVILILTRWHHDDLAGRLLKGEDKHRWKFLNIPAQAGENDILDRASGEYLTSTRGRTMKDWERIKIQAGPRTWNSLYQGNPTPDTGNIFPTEWPTYNLPFWTETNGQNFIPGDVRVIQSWDLAFKATSHSDYVCGQVWALQNGRANLVDMVRGRLDFTQTQQAIKNMSAKWPQARAVYIEDKANGPAIINSLRQELPGLIPVNPDGGKYARAVAVQPFTASGMVALPDPVLLPNVVYLMEEAREFPSGEHDDTVDALTQAVNQLFLKPLIDTHGSIITSEDILNHTVEDLGGY